MVNEALFTELRDLNIILYAHAKEMRMIIAKFRKGDLNSMEQWFRLKNECLHIIDLWEKRYEMLYTPTANTCSSWLTQYKMLAI
jgi:broad specificity phosphatase PhoE